MSSLKNNWTGRQKRPLSHTVTEQSDSAAVSLTEVCQRLTFSLDWPQDAGSDAVDWALAAPTKDSRERYVKSSLTLKPISGAISSMVPSSIVLLSADSYRINCKMENMTG